MFRLPALCALGLSLALLAGCQTGSGVSPYSVAGVRHSEPVEFNGQRYTVDFEYTSALSGYDVQVNRKARPLSDGAGDRANSIQVATSALTHFACANGQKARVVDGTPAFTASNTWSLQARCS